MGWKDQKIAEILRSAAQVFAELCRNKHFAGFYGLRDFYSFAKLLDAGRSVASGNFVKHAVDREFGTPYFPA
jgi:hypothetical protein